MGIPGSMVAMTTTYSLLLLFIGTCRCVLRAGDREEIQFGNDLMIPGSPYTFVTKICEGVGNRVSCKNKGSVIYVEDAFWGRADSHTCGVDNDVTMDTRCKSETAFKLIWGECQGKGSCTLRAVTSF